MGAAWNVVTTQIAMQELFLQPSQPSRIASSGQHGMSPDICCIESGPVLAATGTAIGALARPAITTTASKLRKKDDILIG